MIPQQNTRLLPSANLCHFCTFRYVTRSQHRKCGVLRAWLLQKLENEYSGLSCILSIFVEFLEKSRFSLRFLSNYHFLWILGKKITFSTSKIYFQDFQNLFRIFSWLLLVWNCFFFFVWTLIEFKTFQYWVQTFGLFQDCDNHVRESPATWETLMCAKIDSGAENWLATIHLNTPVLFMKGN